MIEDSQLLNGFRCCEKVLSNLALGASQDYVINELREIVENLGSQRQAVLFLYDEQSHKLSAAHVHKVASNLIKSIEQEQVGQYLESCAASVFLGQAVLVDNVKSHPNWVNYRDLAEQAGIQSCWSVPILSSKGRVFGCFSIFNQNSGLPSDEDLEIQTLAAHIVSVAIEKNQLEQALIFAATHDPLTKLPNRTLFETSANQALRIAERRNLPYCIAFIDINDFKLINDLHGHDIGDKVLIALADVMQGELRGTDVLARLGGDEFIIGLADTSSDGALRYIKRLEKKLNAKITALLNDETIRLAVGIAEASEEYPSLTELIKMADKAMYQDKQQKKEQRKH
ncbi:sensor domain-containing diguanylate cyclase [Catenovulum sp. SM1970]|uniref:diguanylate cyclase n=1 Tax=Marinifaba aquimaris TaxID=2741323 RepID=UPI001573E9E8|nr:sensor domain-containing diguanylate cyclase [Marinifaba aquimaris]